MQKERLSLDKKLKKKILTLAVISLTKLIVKGGGEENKDLDAQKKLLSFVEH